MTEQSLDRAAAYGFSEGVAFVLVESQREFDEVSPLGLNVICLTIRFSETDSRGGWTRRLPLISAWRWRRVCLNESIDRVVVKPTVASIPVMLGAKLAGASVRIQRKRTFDVAGSDKRSN